MDPFFADAMGVDESRAFNFFSTSLRDAITDGAHPDVPRDELLYVSSILAHYALVDDGHDQYLPLPGTLRDLHDLFVTDVATWSDAELMETAAAQTLMLTGYFAGGMRVRHNLETYVGWGRFFFVRAATGHEGRKQHLLRSMSRHFAGWRHRLERLHVLLWENRFLLRLPGGAQ